MSKVNKSIKTQLRATGKIKLEKAARQTELENDAPLIVVKADTGATTIYRNEVSTKEIKQVFADEIEMVYEELGLTINRPSAEDKALNLIRHMRINAKVKFGELV